VGAALAAAAALAVPAVFAGVVTARVDYPFGPHEASYEVTLDSTVALDLGPLGALVMPSPLPGPLSYLGARVVVGPIPEDFAATPFASLETLDTPRLVAELEAYGQAYLGVGATVRRAGRALVLDALARAGLCWLGAAAGLALLGALMGRARLGQLRAWGGRRKPLAAVLAAAVALGGVGVVVGVAAQRRPTSWGEGAPMLAGTPFSSARLTGRFGQLVTESGEIAVNAYRATEEFYAEAAAGVEAAFAAQAAQAAPAAPYGDLRAALFFSDLHCNVGMARVLGVAAQAAGAVMVLDGGDTTMDGTSVERYCVDAVADAIGPEIPWVVAIGNHDTAATAAQARAAGAVVLDGSVERVAGVAILGDSDPTHTELTQGTRLLGDETVEDVGRRLGETACAAAWPVDLLLIHQPAAARVALASGCVPAAVTGHIHTRADPSVVGGGVLYTQSSTGRDTREATMLGPLAAPAEITVLLFDSQNRWVAWQLLTVRPDGGAELSAVRELPVPAVVEPGRAAPDTAGPDAARPDGAGSDGDGSDGDGSDSDGLDSAGSDSAESETADHTGPSAVSPYGTG
jgi:hypothetical protein